MKLDNQLRAQLRESRVEFEGSSGIYDHFNTAIGYESITCERRCPRHGALVWGEKCTLRPMESGTMADCLRAMADWLDEDDGWCKTVESIRTPHRQPCGNDRRVFWIELDYWTHRTKNTPNAQSGVSST